MIDSPIGCARGSFQGGKMGCILEERDKNVGHAEIIASPAITWIHTQNHPEKYRKLSTKGLTSLRDPPVDHRGEPPPGFFKGLNYVAGNELPILIIIEIKE